MVADLQVTLGPALLTTMMQAPPLPSSGPERVPAAIGNLVR